jgi:predicted transcriptional regulator of viral defense system
MNFEDLLKTFRNSPVIDTENLFTGIKNIQGIKVQISRWVKAGKLIQLKRGFYLFSESYRTIEPFGPYLASVLKAPSYVSCEKALEFHGLIPEGVAVYTSVTTTRQAKFSSEAGTFEYRHIKPSLFWGYLSITQNKQTGFMASPEKALLDFFYFKRIHASTEFIEEMRLQNLDAIDTEKMQKEALRFCKPGMTSLANRLVFFIESERKVMKTL